MTTEPLGEAATEAIGGAGYPKTGAAIGTAIQMAPDIGGASIPGSSVKEIGSASEDALQAMGKSLANERGAATLGKTPAPINPWYSRLDEGMSTLPEKADVGQIKNIASKLPQEEQNWRGFNDWVGKQQGQVNKADVMKQLSDNPVELGEKTLQSKQLPFDALGDPRGGVAKFEKYSTPGGENYREVLMKLPEKDLTPTEPISGYSSKNFKSTHFEEPNVLAHIRMKDFVDPTTNKKTLMIDEIQSDWHQKGRTEGYKGTTKDIRSLLDNAQGIMKQSTDAYNAGKIEDGERLYKQAVEMNNQATKSAGGVPDAPFKKNWHELAFKRALKEAVDGGYDEMAWTTGEQQAARYPREEGAGKIAQEHGMNSFYDEMLPSFANKYLKKYGVKAEKKLLELADPDTANFGSNLPSEEAINAGGHTVHYIPITPEMKTDILGKGQPMWQVPTAIGSGAIGASKAEGNTMNRIQTDQEHKFNPRAGLPPGMAMGGLVDPYGVDSGDSGTGSGIQGAPPMPTLPPIGTPPPPIAPPVSPQPQAPALVPPSASSPSGSNDLQDFLSKQNAGLDKYGPEQQMAVEQDILKRRHGLGSITGNAMTGFADALMQGVARAGSSNFQQNLQNRNDKTEEGMRTAMQNAQTGKVAQLNQQMKLGEIDPNSPLSKMAQKANASTLMEAGVPAKAIPFMPASLISDIGTKNITLLDDRVKMQMEQAFRMAGLQLQAEQIHATIGNQQAERRLGAAKESAGQGIWKKVTSQLTPSGRASQAVLTNTMKTGNVEPLASSGPVPVNSQEEYKVLPSGTHYVDSYGTQKVKP